MILAVLDICLQALVRAPIIVDCIGEFLDSMFNPLVLCRGFQPYVLESRVGILVSFKATRKSFCIASNNEIKGRVCKISM